MTLKMIQLRVHYVYFMTTMLRKDRRIVHPCVTSHLNWFVAGSRVNKHRWFDYFARRINEQSRVNLRAVYKPELVAPRKIRLQGRREEMRAIYGRGGRSTTHIA